MEEEQTNQKETREGKTVTMVLPTLSGSQETIQVTKSFLDQCAPIFREAWNEEDTDHKIVLHGLLFEKHANVINMWDQDDQYLMLHAPTNDLMSALGCADYLGHTNWLDCVSSEIAMRVSGMNRKRMAEELQVELDTRDPVLNEVEYLVQDVE